MTITFTENASTYYQGAELPDLPVTWRDKAGALINFATGWTFFVSVARRGSTTPAFTKTDGITGAASEPNVIIAWSTIGELNALTVAGVYTVQITAVRETDSKTRILQVPIHVRPAAGFVVVTGDIDGNDLSDTLDGGTPESSGTGSTDGGTP